MFALTQDSRQVEVVQQDIQDAELYAVSRRAQGRAMDHCDKLGGSYSLSSNVTCAESPFEVWTLAT